MNFSDALQQLKMGFRLARPSWNGSNQYVKMQVPDDNSKMGLPYLYLRNVQGLFVPWVPSMGDLFAEDWGKID